MIVVDASVLVDALGDDGQAGQRSRAALQEDLHWAAPTHLIVEVVSAVRGKVLAGKFTTRRGAAAVHALTQLTIDPLDPIILVDRMWELRANLTAYDAAYIAAAEALDCPLLTGDHRLAHIPGLRCTITLI